MNRWTPLQSLLVLLGTSAAALACPNCKDSVANTAANGVSVGLPAGFNNSIYFMLAGLFCVLGFVGYTVVKGVRSTTALHDARPGFPLK